ncbi:MAG: CPBP family intramembrane glutamic endopeptidase [Bacteroidia bacterium]
MANDKNGNSFLTNKSFNEFIIVIGLGFGLFIYSSTYNAFFNSKAEISQTYNSYDFIFICLYELLVISIIIKYLKHRKWIYNDFNLHFSLGMILVALSLIVFREILGFILTFIFEQTEILKASEKETEINIYSGFFSILLITIINSIYEEVLLIGYIFKRLEKLHPALVISISFIIRESFHTYQGLENLPMVLSISIVFGLYYYKFKKLWPIILAHGISNSIKFANEHFHWFN